VLDGVELGHASSMKWPETDKRKYDAKDMKQALLSALVTKGAGHDTRSASQGRNKRSRSLLAGAWPPWFVPTARMFVFIEILGKTASILHLAGRAPVSFS